MKIYYDPMAYYTVPKLAKRWDVPESTIYNLLKTGRLKGFKCGVAWRISDKARYEYENGGSNDDCNEYGDTVRVYPLHGWDMGGIQATEVCAQSIRRSPASDRVELRDHEH